VDDEAPVRKALGRLLRTFGYEVETFSSGREFLDSLAERRPDCTIVDLHLPGLSGLEVQQHLARQRIDVPCIILTGKDEPEFCERALASGVARNPSMLSRFWWRSSRLSLIRFEARRTRCLRKKSKMGLI
jgi:FixJ family two-component response regulator